MCKNHQGKQERHPDLLADLHGSGRKWTAFDHFDHILH
jgi:hypothetical protein